MNKLENGKVSKYGECLPTTLIHKYLFYACSGKSTELIQLCSWQRNYCRVGNDQSIELPRLLSHNVHFHFTLQLLTN